MIVQIVNVIGVTVLKTEYDPPVSIHLDRPKSFIFPGQRVQCPTDNIQIINCFGFIQSV